MNTKLAEQVEDAQDELSSAVLKALNKFSEDTGLVVTDIGYECTTSLNERGNVNAVGYWGVVSRIATSR